MECETYFLYFVGATGPYYEDVFAVSQFLLFLKSNIFQFGPANSNQLKLKNKVIFGAGQKMHYDGLFLDDFLEFQKPTFQKITASIIFRRRHFGLVV